MELSVPVDGGHLWADDTGGDGPVLVFLHPGWGDSSIWLPVLDKLPSRYRVVRYDTRRFGKSPPPAAPFSQVDPLAPGEIVAADIALGPSATLFRAGETLRPVVAGRWLWPRNPLTGQFPAAYQMGPKGRCTLH